MRYIIVMALLGVLESAAFGQQGGTSVDYPIDVSEMFARDPFVYVDRTDGHYYMHLNDKLKIGLYKSLDLKKWVRVGTTFGAPSDFWGTRDFWAPDTYHYNDKYYVFASFSNPDTKMKGTSILLSEQLEGPYEPLVNSPITPPEWRCLDGSFYVDDGQPWLLFCRAFHSLPNGDGRIYAQKLAADLKTTVGEPILLFRASQAPWSGTISHSGVRGYVTDSPFLYRAENGELLLLWSSFTKAPTRYAIGVARSSNGRIDGEWSHDSEPLNSEVRGGGHAMVFVDLNNQLRIAYHSPNKGDTRAKFYFLKDDKGKLKIDVHPNTKQTSAFPSAISLNRWKPFYKLNFDHPRGGAKSKGELVSLPKSWAFSEAGGGPHVTGKYLARLGSPERHETYSCGSGYDVNDRAFGTLTGMRLQGVTELDFISSQTDGVHGLNGNDKANSAEIAHTITALNIARGAAFWIHRENDRQLSKGYGLSIDDFSLTLNP